MLTMTKPSKNFEKIKGYYESKLWNKNRLRKAVEMKAIREDEYKEIVGEDY